MLAEKQHTKEKKGGEGYSIASFSRYQRQEERGRRQRALFLSSSLLFSSLLSLIPPHPHPHLLSSLSLDICI